MWCPSLRLLSIIVGCLNVLAAFGFTILIITSWCLHYKNFPNAEFDVLAWVGLSILLLVLVAWISFSIMLMMGIFQDRHCLIAPWIYFQFVGMAFMVFVIVINVIQPLLEKIIFTEVKFEFVTDSVITGVIVVCLLPVFILYKSMRRRPPPQLPQCSG